jgi:hypothetical protein
MAGLMETINDPQIKGNAYFEMQVMLQSEDSINQMVIEGRDSTKSDIIELKLRTSSVQHILELKTEELCVVFQRIPFLKLIFLRRVCKNWARQLSRPGFCKNIDLTVISAQITSRSLNSFAIYAGNSLQRLDLTGAGKIKDDAIQTLTAICGNITHLVIKNCWMLTDRSLFYIGNKLIKLTHLCISHCNKLSGAGFQGNLLTKLIDFDASHCKSFTDKSLEKLLTQATDLERIKIRRCTRMTEFGVFLIVRYCRQDLNL